MIKHKNNGYFYKLCNIKGVIYMQIWKKSPASSGAGTYIRSLGTAERLQESLVKYEKEHNKTKELAENLTKISEGKEVEKD